MYQIVVEIEFDRSKSEKNRADRGFGFGFAARIFLGRTIRHQDDRTDYGEIRMVATGKVEETLYTVVYTDRGAVRRIISARRASRKESRQWHLSE